MNGGKHVVCVKSTKIVFNGNKKFAAIITIPTNVFLSVLSKQFYFTHPISPPFILQNYIFMTSYYPTLISPNILVQQKNDLFFQSRS